MKLSKHEIEKGGAVGWPRVPIVKRSSIKDVFVVEETEEPELEETREDFEGVETEVIALNNVRESERRIEEVKRNDRSRSDRLPPPVVIRRKRILPRASSRFHVSDTSVDSLRSAENRSGGFQRSSTCDRSNEVREESEGRDESSGCNVGGVGLFATLTRGTRWSRAGKAINSSSSDDRSHSSTDTRGEDRYPCPGSGLSSELNEESESRSEERDGLIADTRSTPSLCGNGGFFFIGTSGRRKRPRTFGGSLKFRAKTRPTISPTSSSSTSSIGSFASTSLPLTGRRFNPGRKSLTGSVAPLTELEEARDSYVEEEIESGTTIENSSVVWSRRSVTLPIAREPTTVIHEHQHNFKQSERIESQSNDREHLFVDRTDDDGLRKSSSIANNFVHNNPTMTCIKSPRAMSEHLLGQMDILENVQSPSVALATAAVAVSTTLPTANATPSVLLPHGVKSSSLRDHDRHGIDRTMPEVPRQRWSSVRLKGGSTKSLLLENGGPQAQALKGTITKEVLTDTQPFYIQKYIPPKAPFHIIQNYDPFSGKSIFFSGYSFYFRFSLV